MIQKLVLDWVGSQSITRRSQRPWQYEPVYGNAAPTLEAKARLEKVSAACTATGATLQNMSAFESPPSESCSNIVSFEFLQAGSETCVTGLLGIMLHPVPTCRDCMNTCPLSDPDAHHLDAWWAEQRSGMMLHNNIRARG